ncbi:MAG: hypothetical protein JAY88_14725 [Candidatus Thiodiazotropha lotti]|nr:hypothetical protein [Candidatus Thiodiazotropha lotti]MCW4188318.1 hypothetical protein [Candidatus Thiodiazotropha lotti]
MAEEISRERGKVSTLLGRVFPGVIVTLLVSSAGHLFIIRDTVIDNTRDLEGIDQLKATVAQHDNDLRHFKEKCHRLELRTQNLNVLVHEIKNLNQDLRKCQEDIERLERRK